MFHHSSVSSSPSSAPSYSDAALMQQQHHAASFSSAAALSVTVPAQIPRGAGYLDGNVGAFSSPPPSCYSSTSSLPSAYYNYSIQRSISSHSLPVHLQLTDVSFAGGSNGFLSPSSPSPHHQLPLPPLSSSPSSSSGDLFEFTSSSCPVRRVFSTGDLQGMNGSSPPRPAGSGDGQEGGGPFSQKVGRYSAEERKERIERYRVKRHQRNFNKKITVITPLQMFCTLSFDRSRSCWLNARGFDLQYACRKTLADSRPRVKGRFARNGEADAEADEREASDVTYDYCCDHTELSNGHGSNNAHGGGGCYDGGSHSYRTDVGVAVGSNGVAVSALNGAGDNGEWWWRAPGAGAAAADEAQRVLQRQVGGFDEDEELWATLGDMLSVNLAS
ncbi:unnamed protein product [Urochloa decumbens]|uniref:CCT domain-containing protein n=1 Tax=Urochloa decumbens TaxID=240449 RepID=A0ABC8Z4L1_9POAL